MRGWFDNASEIYKASNFKKISFV